MEGDIDSLGGNILAGVARLVVAFGDQLRDETFKEKVGFMSVRQLSRIAKERGAGSLGFAEAMLVAYNRKCKYTLRMTKLHSGRVAEEGDFVDEPRSRFRIHLFLRYDLTSKSSNKKISLFEGRSEIRLCACTFGDELDFETHQPSASLFRVRRDGLPVRFQNG